jgi:ABC-2 type transport system ATP-binding protein
MSNTATPPALHIENLRIDRGGRIVIDSISLSVPAGIITGLLGPSGCGKTTLMRTIVGQQKITAGSATVFDQPAGARSLRRRIGYVTQSPSIYPDLTTVENVRYFARLYGVDKQRACEVIDAVGLTAKKSELAGNLSGGQQGRVSLACALVCDPDLLVLDEPTVGLDPVLRAELWEQFAGLAARGKTLLISSHAMDEARNCANLILMRDGAVLAHAAPADIIRRTACADLESAFMHLVRNDQLSNRPVPQCPITPAPAGRQLLPEPEQSDDPAPSDPERPPVRELVATHSKAWS